MENTVLVRNIESLWKQYSGENIKVEVHEPTAYGFGSELAVLRLLAKYTSNGKVQNSKVSIDYSINLQSWFFRLDMTI